jgi:hypothetical protein
VLQLSVVADTSGALRKWRIHEPFSGVCPDKRDRVKGMTPEERIRRAKIAAHTSWANTANRADRTAAGTRAFLDRFERQVDPDGTLPPDVRARRAQHAKTAYMLRLAERSARARRRRRAQRMEGASDEKDSDTPDARSCDP